MTVVGREGELSAEALAALDPDLVIGYGNSDDPTRWTWWDEPMGKTVNNVAPFVGVKFSGASTPDVLNEYASLAEALGGDTDTVAAREDKEAFESGAERIRTAAAKVDDIEVLALNGDSSELYAGTTALAQFGYLKELGVKFTGPGGDKGWADLSWEQVPDYPADIVFQFAKSAEAFAASPVFVKLPAVTANQVIDFDDKRPNTYANYGAWVRAGCTTTRPGPQRRLNYCPAVIRPAASSRTSRKMAAVSANPLVVSRVAGQHVARLNCRQPLPRRLRLDRVERFLIACLGDDHIRRSQGVELLERQLERVLCIVVVTEKHVQAGIECNTDSQIPLMHKEARRRLNAEHDLLSAQLLLQHRSQSRELVVVLRNGSLGDRHPVRAGSPAPSEHRASRPGARQSVRRRRRRPTAARWKTSARCRTSHWCIRSQ